MNFQARFVMLWLPGWIGLIGFVPPVSGQGFPPDAAVRRMQLSDDLRVTLFASEPTVRQPILVKCDDRGRLWTIQYLQYPNPAGLQRVRVDRWSRTVYDRVPEAPPRGPVGADRITILEDTDGDGRADQAKDFVTGLNLATGLAFGHGGVYVLQVPYLLFYPDTNRDDIPDSDPRVVLEGFGMEDAQSLANHLTWGPDGWLYGVNGSTTTCRIRGIEFQQGCWRYHPGSDRFELFCEGGGNTFGVTFDACGNLFYSTNGGPFVHAVQGGYYYKSFGKHGPLHNPYTYGYFGELQRDQVPGGPPTGGTVYLADSLPERWRGQFLAGNFLGHTVSGWRIQPRGSTFSATYGGVLLDARDTWSGPTDLCVGPDGAIYVSDFYDQRSSHPDPDANWDRSNGRIYKIQARSAPPPDRLDLAARATPELIALLRHPNRWYADRARELLAARRDPSSVPLLKEKLFAEPDPRLTLQYLWALHVSGGIDEPTSLRLLDHPFEYVRAWVVRLLGDDPTLPAGYAEHLAELAERDPHPVVRAQLAATAKRLPAADGLAIVQQLLDRNLDEQDPFIPLLIWWAIESKAISDHERLLDQFARPAAWGQPARRENLIRLVRRYAAEGTAPSYEACWRLLQTAPRDQQPSLRAALERGLAERATSTAGVGQGGLFEQFANPVRDAVVVVHRAPEPLSADLSEWIVTAWDADRDDPLAVRLALRAKVPEAGAYLLDRIAAESAATERRLDSLELLAEFGQPDCIPVVLSLLDAGQPESVRLAALDVLSRFADPRITARLLADYQRMSGPLRSKAREALLRRPQSARALLDRVEQKAIPAEEVPIEQVRLVTLHHDARLNETVRKLWGTVQPGTTEEKLADMRRFQNVLIGNRSLTEQGDHRRGKQLFAKHCGTCHRLWDEGNAIGPDLTSTNRADLPSLLAAIVDPSAVVRAAYQSYVVQTTGGAVLTGLLAEQDAGSITLLDAQNRRTRIARDQVESLQESPASLMPERILEQLAPQELRDLFSYLQSSRP